MGGVEVGQVVSVYGRNTVKIAVPEDKLPLVSRHGTYLRLEDVEGKPLYAITVGYYMRDEIYTSAGIIEAEGYAGLSRSRIELSAKIVGFMEKNTVKKGAVSPPRPGSKAYLASKEELENIMGRELLEIGVLTYAKVHFTLNLDMLASRHLAVLAMTGAGKSNTVAVLLAEILGKTRYPRVLVIDTHSEYVPLARLDPERVHVYAPSGKIEELLRERYGVEPSRLEIPLWSLGFEEIAGLLGLDSRASKQRLLLWNILHSLRRSKWPDASADDPIFFEAERLPEEVETLGKSGNRGGDAKSISDLAFKLRSFIDNPDMDFITRTERDVEIYERLRETVEEPYLSGRVFLETYRRMFQPGINIVALGGLPSEVQVSTASTILKALWRIATAHAQAGHAMPVMVFVEEAHVYASAHREQPSKQILEKIAKEGRKFGVGLAVVSQRPRELSQTLLAQCGTLIALRTSNPEDQKHIMRSIEDIMEELVDSLAGLSVGEAIVSGSAAPLPAVVKVHNFTEKYKIELGGKDIRWHEEWAREPVDTDIVPYLYARARRKRVEEGRGRGLLEYIDGG